MPRKLIVLTTLFCFSLTAVTPHLDAKAIKETLSTTGAPEVDANGMSVEGEGSVDLKGRINTKKGTARVTGKGHTTNASNKKQKYTNDDLWAQVFLDLLLSLFFAEIDYPDEFFTLVYLTILVQTSGDFKARVAARIEAAT